MLEKNFFYYQYVALFNQYEMNSKRMRKKRKIHFVITIGENRYKISLFEFEEGGRKYHNLIDISNLYTDQKMYDLIKHTYIQICTQIHKYRRLRDFCLIEFLLQN